MKSAKLILGIMAVAALILLSSCGNDDDDHPQYNPPVFNDWQAYWNYAQDRECVLFAHVSYEPIYKSDSMYVALWVDKLPPAFSPQAEVAMYVNGLRMYEVVYQEDNQIYLYTDDICLPRASGITVRFDYEGETLIDKCIMIPEAPWFTTVEVSSPDRSANLAWSVPAESEYQVLELWGRSLATEDNISYFMNPIIRNKTIPANTLALTGYSEWEATISQNNILEDRNSTLIAQSYDLRSSAPDKNPDDFVKRIIAMHTRNNSPR